MRARCTLHHPLYLAQVRVASDDFAVDNKEISEARWLPWRVLLADWVAAGRPSDKKNVAVRSEALPEDKKEVSPMLRSCLKLRNG